MPEDRRTRILVVDDEPALCELIQRYFSLEGYDSSMASTGEQALELMQTNHFDMVVTDIMMPGMSGIDLLTIVKSLYPGVVVLMISAVDDLSASSQAIQLGACGYIVKPFSKSQLLISVAAGLEKQRLTSTGPERTPYTHLIVPREHRKVLIRAGDIANLVRSGLDEAAIMERFHLSVHQLHNLFEQLISSGKLEIDELEQRTSLKAGSVVIDMDALKLEQVSAVKPVINARDALECIDSGLDDASIMKRYNISAKGLHSLFRKLVDAGLLNESDLEARRRSQEETVLLE